MPYKNKEDEKKRNKKYYQKHKESMRNANEKWKIEHKEQYRKSQDDWYQKNKTKILEKRSQWYQEHKDEVKQYAIDNKEKIKIRMKNWKNKNREKISEYDNRYKTFKYYNDINFKLKTLLRRRICKMINRNQKAGSAVRDLGCSVEQLKEHLEKQFQNGMSWSNYGKIWEIDHIKALANYDLTNRKQFLEVCHYTNLQPLGIIQNRSKGKRVA